LPRQEREKTGSLRVDKIRRDQFNCVLTFFSCFSLNRACLEKFDEIFSECPCKEFFWGVETAAQEVISLSVIAVAGLRIVVWKQYENRRQQDGWPWLAVFAGIRAGHVSPIPFAGFRGRPVSVIIYIHLSRSRFTE
jgi:hypothetical protein